MTTAQAIRQRILETAQAQRPAAAPPASVPDRSSFLTTFLGVCILLLSVATFWAMLNKRSQAVAAVHPAQQVRPVAEDSQPVPPTPAYVERAEMERYMSQINNRFDEMDKRLSAWTHRVWLIGVAHNENVNLTRQVQASQRIGDPGYIHFDENWKMNRLPHTMQFSQEQQRSLQESVR